MMRLLTISIAAIALGCLSCSSTNGQHIHDDHSVFLHYHPGESANHLPRWYRSPAIHNNVILRQETDTRESAWITLFAHEAENAGCGIQEETISVEKTVTHAVSVGGSFTIGGKLEWAAGALFARCKLEAHASVTMNASYSATFEESVTISSHYNIPPCRKMRFSFEKNRHDVAFTWEVADHEFTCLRYDDEQGYVSTKWYCNKGTLTGVGIGHDVTKSTWTDVGKVPGCDCGESNGETTNGD